MTDSISPQPDSSAEPTQSVTNVSGGVNLEAQHDVTVGGDAVGRDKNTTNIDTKGGSHVAGDVNTTEFVGRDNIESAGHDIIHAASGATVTVITGVPHAPEPEDLAPAPGEPPFKGLQYFDEADAELFFGREQLTAQLAGRFRDESFLAIVGASGSGKSSLVRAGLIATLQRNEPLADGTLPPSGSDHWPVHILTPTSHPLEALAVSLTRDSESVTATATLMDDLAADARSLHLTVLRVTQLKGVSRLLLVVDQFEELFTACKNEVERKAFINNLLYAAGLDGSEGPTVLVLMLRADFYAQCAQYDNLREALEKRQKYIGAMSSAELRRAIEEPAKRGHWEFEPGLVDLLLRDVGDEPGALPLLSHALLETWRRRQGRRLTLEGYHMAGGVHGAIAKTADDVYQHLKPEQQTIARNIFLRLTELGEDTQDTRRRVALSELMLRPEDQPVIEGVLQTLVDARLVTTEQDAAEVAHEALIREWPTLRSWLDEDREQLRLQQQLRDAAQEWQQSNWDEGVLYRGARLLQATEWAKSHANEMNTLEREFLEASRVDAERDAATVRKAARQNKIIGVVSLVAIILAIAAGISFLFLARRDFVGQVSANSVLADVPLAGSRTIVTGNTILQHVINGLGGEILVVPGRSDEISTNVMATVSGDSLEAARIRAARRITVTNDAGKVEVRLLPEAGGKDPDSSYYSARLRVHVPPAIDLPDISMPSGNIEVYGPVGNVTATITDHGHIVVFGVDGNVNLSTQRGSIIADIMPGRDITLRASEGNIDLYAVEALVSAATTDGNVRFYGTLRAGQTHYFTTTAAGSIQVAVPAYPGGYPKPQIYRFYVNTSASPVNVEYPARGTDNQALPICGFIHSSEPYDSYDENTLARTGRIEVSPTISGTYFFSSTLATTYIRFDTSQPRVRVGLYAPLPQSIHIYTATQISQIIAGKESIAPDCRAALEADSGNAIVLKLNAERGPVSIQHTLLFNE